MKNTIRVLAAVLAVSVGAGSFVAAADAMDMKKDHMMMMHKKHHMMKHHMKHHKMMHHMMKK